MRGSQRNARPTAVVCRLLFHATARMKYDLSMPLCGDIDIENLSISVLQKHLTHGNFTAQDLAACYLERIRRLNGLLRLETIAHSDGLFPARMN